MGWGAGGVPSLQHPRQGRSATSLGPGFPMYTKREESQVPPGSALQGFKASAVGLAVSGTPGVGGRHAGGGLAGGPWESQGHPCGVLVPEPMWCTPIHTHICFSREMLGQGACGEQGRGQGGAVRERGLFRGLSGAC